MAEATQLKVAPPLPATRTDLLAGYKLKRRRSINDLVEEIVVKLWDNDEQFMKYVDAIYNEQAVEGSLDDDDTMAAIIIRDTAKRDKHMEVANKIAMVVINKIDRDVIRPGPMAEDRECYAIADELRSISPQLVELIVAIMDVEFPS